MNDLSRDDSSKLAHDHSSAKTAEDTSAIELLPDAEGDTASRPAVVPGSEMADFQFRCLATRTAVIATWVLAAFFFGWLVFHSTSRTSSEGSWMLTVIEEQFAACISIPLSAISAVCIVLILESTAGPIQFEAIGFKFRGASGPIILWLFSFLAIVSAVKLLWVPD